MPEPLDRGTGNCQQPSRPRLTLLLATGVVAIATLAPVSATAAASGVPGDGGSGLGSASLVTTPPTTSSSATTAPVSSTKTTSSAKTTPTATTAPSAAVPYCSSTAPSLGSPGSTGISL